jgi:hypothetical protein
MDRSELRSVVFEVLKKTPHTHFRAVENDARRHSEAYERRDVLLLNEILWDLLRQGVLAPGKNSLNPDLPFLHVTDYGARCLEEDSIIAHDPDRYVARLIETAGAGVPDVVVDAARLGLLALLDGHPEASLVLLAHAAEQVLSDLAEALIRRGRRDGRGTKRLEGARCKRGRLPNAVLRALGGRHLPKELDDAEGHVSGLDGLVSSVRSVEGAPRIPKADHDLSLARFLLFPDQCRFAYHAIRWLEGASDA